MDLEKKLKEVEASIERAKEFYIKLVGAKEMLEGLLADEATPKDKKEKK